MAFWKFLITLFYFHFWFYYFFIIFGLFYLFLLFLKLVSDFKKFWKFLSTFIKSCLTSDYFLGFLFIILIYFEYFTNYFPFINHFNFVLLNIILLFSLFGSDLDSIWWQIPQPHWILGVDRLRNQIHQNGWMMLMIFETLISYIASPPSSSYPFLIYATCC